MKRLSLSSLFIIMAVLLLLLVVAAAGGGCFRAGLRGGTQIGKAAAPLSPREIAASRDGSVLYVTGCTGRCIIEYDTKTNAVRRSFPIPDQPSGLALSPDGNTLYVTAGIAKGYVRVIDLTSGTFRDFTAGHAPCAPVISPDGSRLYVMNRFANTMMIMDSATGRAIRTAPMLREPFSAAITPDGRYIFVANRLPTGDRMYDYVTDGGVLMLGSYISTGYFSGNRESYAAAGVVLVFDTKFNRHVELIVLPNGSTCLNGLAMSPDGNYVYVTHVHSRYHLPTSQIGQGWIATNAVSVIDANRMKLVNTVPLDDLDRGAANPWGVACSPDGSRLFVAHGGTDEISVIDRMKLHDRLKAVVAGDSVCASGNAADVQCDLTFLHGIRERIRLQGKGPRGIVASGNRVYVAEYFTDSIGCVACDDTRAVKAVSMRLGPETPLTEIRRGEMYFSDAALCYQSWLSCETCHPDGRTDGLNWDLLNDGVGNPKNTKSLLYSHQTPPVMVTGIRKDAETAVRAGFRHIQFAATDEKIASAVDAYLKSLEPLPSPWLDNGKQGRRAKRGAKIFVEAGCAACHPAPLFTDRNAYDVGTGIGRDAHTLFDTPTLVELWRTKPYLYDGRADSMFEVFKVYNRSDAHGVTAKMEPTDMSDLVEYILTR